MIFNKFTIKIFVSLGEIYGLQRSKKARVIRGLLIEGIEAKKSLHLSRYETFMYTGILETN